MINLVNKTVVLFGNAKSVLDNKRKVDTQFDFICRINSGVTQGKEQYLGTKTDILFLSLSLSEIQFKKFNTKCTVWCTPKRELMQKYLKPIVIYYPIENWNVLYALLKTRPSTGLMAFDYLLAMGFETLTLFGFDFWRTPNWYTEAINLAHDPVAEKDYIFKKVKEYKGRIII